MVRFSPEDQVTINLTVSQQGGSDYPIRKTYSANTIGLCDAGADQMDPPMMDMDRWRTLIESDNPDDNVEAQRLQKQHAEALQKFAANAGATKGDAYATRVVDFLIENGIDGNKFSREGHEGTYGVSEAAINITGPVSIGGVDHYTVSARASFGQ